MRKVKADVYVCTCIDLTSPSFLPLFNSCHFFSDDEEDNCVNDDDEYLFLHGSSSSSLSPTTPMPPLPPLPRSGMNNLSTSRKTTTMTKKDVGCVSSPPRPAKIMFTSAMSIDDDDVKDEIIVDFCDEDVDDEDVPEMGVAWSCRREEEEDEEDGVSPVTPSSNESQPITSSPSSMSITSVETEAASDCGVGGGGGNKSLSKRGAYVGKFVDRIEK